MTETKPPLSKALCLLLMHSLPMSAATLVLEEPALETYETVAAAMVDDASFGEYEIKAGFIYRFLSFVSWPDNLTDDGTMTIGILGKNPFGNAFHSIDGRTVGNRVVKVRFFGSDAEIKDLKDCQLLYVSASIDKRLQEILKALENSPVLTIGDRRGFIDQGGMIGFVSRGKDQLGIEINVAAANRVHLTIRSMLKRIAVRIIDEP